MRDGRSIMQADIAADHPTARYGEVRYHSGLWWNRLYRLTVLT